MTNKRHLVLYGIGILVLLGVAIVFMIVRKNDLSDTHPASVATTTSTLTEPPKPVVVATATPAVAPTPFQFEVVTTQAAQEKGLGGRTDVPSNYGMLFVFPKDAPQQFWMKDMLVPIDMIWIRDDGTVAGIEREVSPKTYPKIFTSPEPVRYVLETRAAEAGRLGITTGTKLNLPLPYGRTVSE
jgi:uncharacterized membrane protein (UPF0127 family)